MNEIGIVASDSAEREMLGELGGSLIAMTRS